MSQRARSVLCLTVAMILVGRAALAQGTGNDRCVSLINNDARKVLDARAKADKKCVHGNKGASATACIDGTDAKTETKKAKLVSRFGSSCAPNPPAFGVAPGGAAAVNAAAEGAANDIAHDLFGAGVVIDTGARAKCQEKVTQRAGQLVVTRWREFRSCKRSGLSGFADATALAAGCLGGADGPQPDPSGRIASRGAKLADAVQKLCVAKGITPVESAFPGACTGTADALFDDCVAALVACRFCEAIKAADGLPGSSLNCDVFDNGAVDGTCGPLPTSTPTLTPTPTPTVPPTPTIPDICQPDVPVPPAIAQVPFTVLPGSPSCALNPPPEGLISGSVQNGASVTIGELGLGCLYAGALEGLSLPSGGTAFLDVTGVQLLPPAVTLGGSDGTGTFDCTRGAGPDRYCTNDPNVTCVSDADCGGSAGTCNLEAHCYFGPPIPLLFGGTLGTCVINAFLTDMCGQVTLLPPAATLATALSARVYLTGDPDFPCPLCVGCAEPIEPGCGTCTSGKNAGSACTPLGSENTSIDCPPDDVSFLTALTVPIPELTTGTSTMSEPSGFFCPDQTLVGAFHLTPARTVTEIGSPPLGGGGLLSMTLAATFCIPESGNSLVDIVGGLPGVGAVTAAGELDLSQLP